MDLWYIANRVRGTLPAGFENLNTVEIAKKMGIACHAVRADYTLPRPKESLLLRGFGLDNHPDYPFRLEMRDFPVRFEHDEENLKTWIATPAGEVFTHILQSKEMLKDGISLPFVQSYPIRTVDDLEAVAQVFEHLEVIPAPKNYRRFKDRIGDQGLAIANGMPFASPIHYMLHDLIAMDRFYYMYMDSRDEMHAFAQRITPFFERVLDAVLASDCEAFLWGGNYDQNTTYPAFFEEEIAPWLRHAREKAAKAGKYVVSHTDGENNLLLPLYPKAGFQIAESVCAEPMTLNSLKEIRQGMGEGIVVWGGVPAVVLMEETFTDSQFDAYVEKLFAELGTGAGLIFGVSDNVPPDVSLKRMQRIKEKIAEFGPVEGK